MQATVLLKGKGLEAELLLKMGQNEQMRHIMLLLMCIF